MNNSLIRYDFQNILKIYYNFLKICITDIAMYWQESSINRIGDRYSNLRLWHSLKVKKVDYIYQVGSSLIHCKSKFYLKILRSYFRSISYEKIDLNSGPSFNAGYQEYQNWNLRIVLSSNFEIKLRACNLSYWFDQTPLLFIKKNSLWDAALLQRRRLFDDGDCINIAFLKSLTTIRKNSSFVNILQNRKMFKTP